MGRQSKHASCDATNLVNFHFSTPPTRDPQSLSQQRSKRGHHHRQKNAQEFHRTAQDKASVRRRAGKAMFPLHSSADHAFALTRRTTSKLNATSTASQGSNTPYSFAGSDVPVSWSAVRMVKQYVQMDVSGRMDQPSCPICLCDFVCPRITKCGHTFCYSCLLRHMHTESAAKPNHHSKCPCCGVPTLGDDLRPVILETLTLPAIKNKIKLVKLHRQKNCPAPFLPSLDAPMHGSPHAAPTFNEADAKYSRFNYTDPTIYQAHLEGNREEIDRELASGYVDDVERFFLELARGLILQQLENFQGEVQEELSLQLHLRNPTVGVYQPQSPALEYKRVEAPVVDEVANGTSAVPSPVSVNRTDRANRDEGSSVGQEVEPVEGTKKPNDSSMQPQAEDKTPAEGGKHSKGQDHHHHPRERQQQQQQRHHHRHRREGTMYAPGWDTNVFYQADDGQLVFLNGFNMQCLLFDFSKGPPDRHDGAKVEESESLRPPLPDVIVAHILDVERIHLTPEVRKRMAFLSHLPLYIDVLLVEVDMNHILSDTAKDKFRSDLSRRKKRRQAKVAAARRADRTAKKEEEDVIASRKARIQRIDPNDDFFHGAASAPAPAAMTTAESALVFERLGTSAGTGTGIPHTNQVTSNNNHSSLGGDGSSLNAIPSSRGGREGTGGMADASTAILSNGPTSGTTGVNRPSPTQKKKSTGPTFSDACKRKPAGFGKKYTYAEAFPTLGGGVTATGINATGNAAYSTKAEAPPVPSPTKKVPPKTSSVTTRNKKGKKGNKVVLFSTGGQRGSPY